MTHTKGFVNSNILESSIPSLNGEGLTFQESQQNLIEPTESLNQVQFSINQFVSTFNKKIVNLNTEIKQLKSNDLNLKNELQIAINENINLDKIQKKLVSQKTSLVNELKSVNSSLELLTRENKNTQKILTEKSQENLKLQNKILTLNQSLDEVIKKLKYEQEKNIEINKNLIAASIRDAEKQAHELAQKDLIPLQTENLTLGKSLQITQLENAELQKRLQQINSEQEKTIYRFQQINNSANEMIVTQDLEIKKLQAENEKIRSYNINLKFSFQKHAAEDKKINSELQSELDRIKNKETSLNEQNSTLRTQVQNLQDEVMKSTARFNESYNHSNYLKNKTETLKEDLLQYKNKYQEMQILLDKIIFENKNLNEKVLASRSQIQSLEKENHDLNLRITSKARNLETDVAHIEAREIQLTNYGKTLNQQKNEIKKYCDSLAREIRQTTTFHPLKDYLAFTEYELVKSEQQLKSTPIISKDRPALELTFNQLLEQREFLKSLISSSQKQMDAQAAQIQSLLQEKRLAEMPPLPPTLT